MWTILFAFLFLSALIALVVVLASFTKKLGQLEKERADIEVEENRVFDFLHGLGEAFSEGVRPADLHRLIVEWSVRILEAHGGALYLVDKNGSLLVPAFVSNGCPPLVELPRQLFERSGNSPPQAAVESYVRLHSIKMGEGVLGAVCQSGEIALLSEEDFRFDDNRPLELQVHSALAGPLVYRRQLLGLLVVANGHKSTPFRRDERSVFKTILEQSAFALFNESIYSQASEKKLLDHDLQMAREIQSVLLPAAAPSFPGFELAGTNIPARQVSGDYFDFITLPDSRLAVAIADVSGKGIAASLLMAMCRSVLRSQALTSPGSPAEILRRVNRLLYPDIKEDMFISMALVILEQNSSDALLARAGHDPPLLFRSSTGHVESLSPRGMALGVDQGRVFDRVIEDYPLRLQPGDTLIFYTDGATEAMDAEGAEFGLPRLEQAVQVNARYGAFAFVRKTSEELSTFIGSNRQYDDITLIAVQKL